MASQLKTLERKIQLLQVRADKLREQEVRGVVDRIKVAIEHYGLTAEQLGLGPSPSSSAKTVAPAKKKKSDRPFKRPVATAKYSDAHGRQWSGRGRKPQWLRDAIEAGGELKDFAVGDTVKAAGTRPARVKSKRAPSQIYQDDAGNTWGGMGPRPKWLRDALESGAQL